MDTSKNYDLKSNKIVLRSVYGKEMKYIIQPTRDPKTGRFPNCVRPINKDGDIILSEAERAEANSGKVHYIPENAEFTIVDGTTFDLDDIYQRAEWEAIKNCSIIAESRTAKDAKGYFKIDGDVSNNRSTARYGKAELYVERPGLITEAKVNRVKLRHKAVNYVLNDERGADGLRLRAKLLGRNMENQPTSDVEDFLLQIAEKDPQRIIDLYNEEKIAYRLLFVEAKDKHVITYKDKCYWYGEMAISATDEGVLTWLQQASNASTVNLIRRQVYPELETESDKTSKKTK